MSIQKKLVLSFGAMVLVPIVLFTLATFAMFYVFSGGEGITQATSSERIDHREDFFSELKLKTTEEPTDLLENDYLQEIDAQLNLSDYGLLVRVNNELVYQSQLFSEESLLDSLPTFGEFINHTHESIRIHDIPYKLRQHDFYFPNQQQGSIFIVEEASAIEQFSQSYLPAILIILVLILIFTNGLLSYFVSRSFIKPIKLLQKSTEQIQQGDLTFELKTNRKDEIGELMTDFEEMRRKLQESIERQIQYENDRKLLLSNISHDLKTPISSIKGYIEGINDGIANTEEKRNKYLHTIYKRADDMDAMINELFLYSTLDMNQAPFHFSKLDLVRYVSDYLDELQIDLEKKGIELLFNPGEASSLFVQADREKITRVIDNIIQNSIKYLDKDHSMISLSILEREQDVLLKIEDNGRGISEDDIPHIFETFYRADASRNKHTGGTGLGLAIAKQIIEGHEGQIWSESQLGKGTMICFTLPLKNKRVDGDKNEKNINH